LYGFAPASIVGNDIHTISNKNTIRLFRQPLNSKVSLTFSTGFSLNYSITKNTFIFLPKYYPDKYYSTNAIRFAPFISSNFIYKNDKNIVFKNINTYFELSTLDNYLWYYVKTGAFNFTDIWNLAIGINIPLIKKD